MISNVVQQAFDVFISYSRKDGTVASKLEAALRRYRPPKDLPVPQRPLSVFRDQEDIAGSELSEALESSLRASAKLLVLCSPDSRASPYVYKEIEVFGRLRGRDHIIPILVRGIPNMRQNLGRRASWLFRMHCWRCSPPPWHRTIAASASRPRWIAAPTRAPGTRP